MTVQELIHQLQQMNPEAEVRFFHLRRVMDDGTGRVDSYPLLEVVEDDDEVTLSDFQSEDYCLYRVKQVEWSEQPALKRCREDAEEIIPTDSIPSPKPSDTALVEPLLVEPSFTRAEWSLVAFDDIGEEGTPLGRRVLEYLSLYHKAVMHSNRVPQLLDAAGLPDLNRPFRERWFQKLLRRMVKKHQSTVRDLEILIAVGDFGRYLKEQPGVSFGPETLEWLEKVEALAIVTLVVCVNRHFGLTP